MITLPEVAWLAGLLEGEGCFRMNGKTPSITLSMTDFDVMVRAKKLMGETSVLYPLKKMKAHYKQCYVFRASSHVAAGWMMTLYLFMGKRRRAKIRECLTAWNKIQPRWQYNWRAEAAKRGDLDLLMKHRKIPCAKAPGVFCREHLGYSDGKYLL